MNYYLDNDPHAAAWLRNLIEQGLIPEGTVDERSITDVRAVDLLGYRHVSLFAGIAGWQLALDLAGWTAPCWTVSCPCQPFSTAGKGKAEADERHLWPVVAALVRECKPDCIFGEQVASRAGYHWLDGVRADLEAEGYAFGAADLPACSAGAPHVRQRLFWFAHRGGWQHEVSGVGHPADAADGGRREQQGAEPPGAGQPDAVGRGEAGGMALAEGAGGRLLARGDGSANGEGTSEVRGRRVRRRQRATGDEQSEPRRATGRVGQPPSGRPQGRGAGERDDPPPDGGGSGESARTDAHGPGRLGSPNLPGRGERGGAVADGAQQPAPERPGDPVGFWDDFALLPCSDGKARRTQPGLQPLVDGLPFLLADGRTREDVSRAKVLRQIGNAIVPQAAALFVRAVMDTLEDR